MTKLKQTFEKAVKLVNYDGSTEKVIEYYESMKDFKKDTMFDTQEDFDEYVNDKFYEKEGIRPSDFKGEIIVLDSVGHIDGEIFIDSDSEETILDSIQTYFE